MCHEWFPESFPTRKKNEKAKFQETLKVGDVFQGFSMKKEAGAYMDSFMSKWCVKLNDAFNIGFKEKEKDALNKV